MFLLSVIICLVPSTFGLDFACTVRLGHCQEDNLSCSGSYKSGLCSGHASRRCCVPVHSGSDSRCTNQGGHCQEKATHCSGSYVSGLCSGSASRKCCFPSAVLGSGISQNCLDCICKQESGCRPLGCHMDVGSLSCGYFQIKAGYWHDCGKPGGSWEACAKDKRCAEQCVRRNMRRYGTFCTGKARPSCEDYARIHNGGPHGCRKSSTLSYWHHVTAHGCTATS